MTVTVCVLWCGPYVLYHSQSVSHSHNNSRESGNERWAKSELHTHELLK